jgi:hypothetical protein
MNTVKYGLIRPFTGTWPYWPSTAQQVRGAQQSCSHEQHNLLQDMKILSNKSCYMDNLIRKAIRVDLHPSIVNSKAGLVCTRSWNLSFTPSEHRGTLHCLWCPMSFSRYASLSPLLICCFYCTSLHLDHNVNPRSQCGDIMVPIKPNNPNSLTTHCWTQLFTSHLQFISIYFTLVTCRCPALSLHI